MKRRSITQNRASVLVGISGTLLAFAGVIPPIITGETNQWFWLCVIGGIGALVVGLLIAASDRLFNRLRRLLFGDPVVLIRAAEDNEIEAICTLAEQEFGSNVTSAAKAREIRNKYKEAFKVAICKDRYGSDVIRGYYAGFPINKSLVEKIERFNLNIQNLDRSEVATKPQYGYAFYIGGIVGVGLRVRAELLGAMKLDHRRAAMTKTKTVYARAATKTGVDRLSKYRFQPVHSHADGIGCFFRKTLQ